MHRGQHLYVLAPVLLLPVGGVGTLRCELCAVGADLSLTVGFFCAILGEMRDQEKVLS